MAFLDIVSDILTAEFYDLDCCCNTDIFWQKLHLRRPDLILLDGGLSDGGSSDICKMLKSAPSTKDIPVILLTTSTREDLENRMPACETVIFKPFDLSELIRKVRSLLT